MTGTEQHQLCFLGARVHPFSCCTYAGLSSSRRDIFICHVSRYDTRTLRKCHASSTTLGNGAACCSKTDNVIITSKTTDYNNRAVRVELYSYRHAFWHGNRSLRIPVSIITAAKGSEKGKSLRYGAMALCPKQDAKQLSSIMGL